MKSWIINARSADRFLKRQTNCFCSLELITENVNTIKFIIQLCFTFCFVILVISHIRPAYFLSSLCKNENDFLRGFVFVTMLRLHAKNFQRSPILILPPKLA